MRDFLVQLIGFIPSLIAITALQSPNRKKILILQFICCIMWFTHYALLGAVTVMATNVIGMGRAVISYYNDRDWANSRWIPVGLGALYVVSAIATWQGTASIFVTIAMLLTTAALWSHNMRMTRLLFLLNSPLMLASDIVTGSYSCAVIEIIAFISFAIAVYRYDIRGQYSAETQADRCTVPAEQTYQ